VAWPLIARAQQAAIPTVGFIGERADGRFNPAFFKGLSETGYASGRNVAIEYRWVEGHNERLPSFAQDLIGRGVSVIAVPNSTAAALAAKAATTTIPIVFRIGGDPVSAGLVASFNRPGGNVTGITTQTAEPSKRLQLVRELLPTKAPIAFLVNPVGGFIVPPDGGFNQLHRAWIRLLAARSNVPAVYPVTDAVRDGGLLSYGPDRRDIYRRSASYVDRILRGEKPGDLPVQLPVKFEMAVNLKTAKALGLKVPQSILLRADEVIE
jgi:putative ABC transport system substrate-binding protein